MFFDFPVFIDKFDSAICKSYSNNVTSSLGERHPVVIDGIRVQIKPFSGLSSVDVPFIDDIVVSDTV